MWLRAHKARTPQMAADAIGTVIQGSAIDGQYNVAAGSVGDYRYIQWRTT